MSESPKMGLFGSKDDNTETPGEKKDTVKPNEAAQDRDAPYNIDSDSETYDTEALSILDINDIIGIQAEAAGDSTLESEIAALAEVITDIKSDELPSGVGRALDAKKSSAGQSDRNKDVGSTQDRGLEKDNRKEDTSSQVDAVKPPDSASMAGINKSLLLIGESYISDDSQDTDVKENPSTSVPKSVDLSKSLEELINKDADGAVKNSSAVVESADEKMAPKDTIADECPAEINKGAASDEHVEPTTELLEDDLKSTQVNESDSTDSPTTDVSPKQNEEENKTERMDVDSGLTQDVGENVNLDKSLCNKSEESKPVEKVDEDSETKLDAVEIENLPAASAVEPEEPMEVDQPNEEVSTNVEIEKADPGPIEEAAEDKPRPSDSVVVEKAEIVCETGSQPEENKKLIDEVVNDEKSSPEPEIREESLDDQVPKAEPSNSGVEEDKISNIVEKEVNKSSSSTKDAEITGENIEMETDESQVKESPTENIEVKSPVINIAESVEETVDQARTTAKDDEPKTSSDKAKVEQEIFPDSSEEVGEIARHSIMQIVRDETQDIEPMEVDDNAKHQKNESDNETGNSPEISGNTDDIGKPVGDIVVSPKQSASDETIDTTLDSRSNVSDNTEAVANTVQESSNNETIVTSSVISDNSLDVVEPIAITASGEREESETPIETELSENPVKIVESAPIVLSNESVVDKLVVSDVEAPEESSLSSEAMETEEALKESSEEVVLAVAAPDLSEKSSEIVEAVPDIIPEVIGPSVVATEETAEDEKMEVDAGTKKEKRKIEESAICQPEPAQKSEESPVSTAQEVDSVEEKSTTEKTDDLDKIKDLEITEKTVDEDVEVPNETTASESSEIETTKNIDETDEAVQELKQEEKLPLIAIQKGESSAEVVHETVTIETPDDVVTKEEEAEKVVEPESKKEENLPLIAIQKDESSPEVVHETVTIETPDDVVTKEEEAEKLVEPESKKVENLPLIAVQKDESSAEVVHESVTIETPNDIVVKEEEVEKLVEPESKKEENLPLIAIQKDESSAEVAHETVTTETPGDVATKEEEVEKLVEPDSKKEENAIPSEKPELPPEKSPEMDVTNAPEVSVDEITEDKNDSVKPEVKEAESSMEIAETATHEIQEIEAAEKPGGTAEVLDEGASKNDQPNEEEDKAIIVESTECSLAESSETETTKTPVIVTKENLEVVEDKTAIMTEDETEESLKSVENLTPSTMSSEFGSTEPREAIIKDVEDEKVEAEIESKKPVSTDTSSKTIEEIPRTEATQKAIIEDAKEEMEEMESEPTLAVKELPMVIDVTAEVVEDVKMEISQKDTEESESTTLEKKAETNFVFPKPEAPQQETSRCDLSSLAMDSEDVEGEEDPVEEEMNLSLDPDIAECQESDSQVIAGEETQRIGETSSEAPPPNAVETEETQETQETEETENQADVNLSFEPEEKTEELPCEKLVVEDSVDESSMISAADKPVQSDERLEKPNADDDDDDNSKDILSTMVHDPDIFHDEQSQNTQEMMDSILETDSSNFNKILDDEEKVGAALACAADLPLVEAEIDDLADKLPSESEEMLNKALDDPMSSQNIDSLEGLLDLDLMQEGDESNLKSVEPIVAKVMNDAEEDIETKDVDVSLLLEETEQEESINRGNYPDTAANSSTDADVLPKIVCEEAIGIAEPDENLSAKSPLMESIDSPMVPQLEVAASALADNDIDVAFDLPIVETDPAEADPLASEDSKLELTEDLLREIAVDEERKMELAEKLLLDADAEKDDKIDLPEDILLQTAVEKQDKINLPADLLLQTAVEEETDVNFPAEVLLSAAVEAEGVIDLDEEVLLDSPVPEDPKMELSDDVSLEKVVRDQVLTAAAEIEDLPANSEISELESAVKFLQESEEQGIASPLVLSPKMVDSVVDEIVRDDDVGIFVTGDDICEDPSVLVADLESIIPDPIAISEAEIISEAAKLESERKSELSEKAKLQSPIVTELEKEKEIAESPPPPAAIQEHLAAEIPHPETPKTHREPREIAARSPTPEKVEQAPLLKKSAPIPKISILEERLKEPPKIEIPSVSEVSRMCEMPTTPKTSLLIQRDAKLSSFQRMLESPKSGEKTELKIVDTPRKDADKHDFENVGSPRIILKIAKSAIADCGEPRSPKSPKIRSATNSPNPEDSPGQKLGKIKLKLSKGGHPSIISNENVEEVCGQWHTEGTSSLSPLGMKIKFSKTGDASIVQTDKHETADDAKEPPKHKFEEAKRTESPIGMKIKFSKTGDASIVQQDAKESTSKHKDKLEIMQGSPKRNESPLGMKIKFSKSGDASIIQPEKTLDSSEDHREGSSRGKDKLDVPQDVPRRTESPLGMKFKLFKTGDASIVASEVVEDSPQETKRTDSPLGMKIKLSKSRGSASIVQVDSGEDVKERLDVPDVPRRTESPLGMKIKFSKTGDASIIHSDDTKETAKHKERADPGQESAQTAEPPIGVKMKVTKSRDASTLPSGVSEEAESVPVAQKRTESSIGMKFKLSKTGDASIVHPETQDHVEEPRSKERAENVQEAARKPDAAIGMKIKFSKSGDASIIQPQLAKKSEDTAEGENEHQRSSETALPMKIKLQKSGDASIVEPEKKDKSTRRKETDSPLEMKIKLSKTGHPTIVACDNFGESSQRAKDTADSHKHKESTSLKEMPGMKMLKSMHSAMHSNRAELTIEPIQLPSRKSDGGSESAPKRKDVTISPVESKKAKLEAKLSHMLPEVTIQPIKPREQKPMMFDNKASSISRQQMNVISQEISITQVRSNKAMDLSMSNKLKTMLAKNATTSAKPDCEIIEHRPELIIVNENSNSSQDVMIIEEVPALRGPDAKVPKKRGRPRRNPLPLVMAKPMDPAAMPTDGAIPRDPLALDDVPQLVPQMTSLMAPKVAPQTVPPKENERPKRSCSRQKSYAPPRRGRGRGGGRGKRKMEMEHLELSKKPRIDQDLNLIEQSTTALITIDEPAPRPEISHSTSELYKALRQPPMDHKMANAMARVEAEQAVNDADLLTKESRESLMDSRIMSHLDGVMNKPPEPPVTFDIERKMSLESLCSSEGQTSAHHAADQMEKTEMMIVDDKTIEKTVDEAKDHKDAVGTQDHQNWLTPSSKRLLDGRNEGSISSVQVIDEETRMSAESSSRSQTPARNMTLQAPETIVNEESQGSVLSTATTESEKVKVKNRRMEINFDPDEGPFTVDKIAEYEWPLDPTRKSETFMIQEQISQYLGVKSFKRKYPDLKRRMVDMEERNFLRENALVSEAMCDMGLTAVGSSEVLDIMCNDFPDQYEEYRKYIREKQMKEHSKKQKELTAAANAEKNRIDLAEMAVQSALSWNVGLNKARRESRKCSLDLQTFTIHVPKKQQKVEEESRQSHYPVALIPGQYTDYYREYTPAELRYYPLNTVLYGPMKPNERKLDSQSEGSQSDSDSDSSSDDSSSSSSDGTQDTEESQSTMDEVDVELSRQKEDIKSIKCKMCLKHLNKFSRTEVLIQCGTCNGYVHPSCIDLTLDMVPHIQAYAWQCTDCKTCAQCHDPADEDKMLFCDMCDRGYHIYCVGLRRVPQGRWHCQECAVCASCGSREAGGANSDRNSVAQWQHEYKKGDKNTRVYVSTLCVPCSKLCGDQGPDNRSEKLPV